MIKDQVEKYQFFLVLKKNEKKLFKVLLLST